jgi:phage tail sheath protein FI
VDRERGAHHTPANTPLVDAVDIEELSASEPQVGVALEPVNPIRGLRNKGLVIWGGRTLDPSPAGRFVAHRRFIHRLIRAIRRLAQPLVFEAHRAELRGTLVRGVTSVLLEAFRGGALRGERPEEAFFVTCDEQTNPPEQRENGRVECEIGLALAVPMEFITIRVALSREGELEVFES